MDEGYGTEQQHSTLLDRLTQRILAVHPDLAGRTKRELRGEEYDRTDVLSILPANDQGMPIEIGHDGDFDELIVGMGRFWHEHFDTNELSAVVAAVLRLMDSNQVVYERVDKTGKVKEAGSENSIAAVTPHLNYETNVYSWSGKYRATLPPSGA